MPETNGAEPVVLDPSTVVTPPAALTAEDITRIIDAKLGIILDKIVHPATPGAPAQAETDDLDAVAQELAKEEGIELKTAKSFVNKFVKIAKHSSKGVEEELNNMKLRDRFTQVFAANPNEDVMKVTPKMTEVFNRMNPMEKAFVLGSPDGAEFIYTKAKKELGMYVQPSDTRVAASNPPGRSANPVLKLGGKEQLLDKATACLTKGDRKGYEEYMDQITRG